MMTTIPGGGDSLFQCFSQFLHGKLDLHLMIRQEVVQELLDNREKYHLPKGREAKQTLKQLQLTKYPGQLPFTHSIEAFSNIYLVQVLVYYSKDHPLHFGNLNHQDVCCLYCLGGIHYNLLTPNKSKLPQTAIDVISDSPDVSKPPKIYHILTLDDTENEDDGVFVNNADILLEVVDDDEINPSVLPMENLQINNFSLLINPQDSVEVTMTHIMESQLNDPILKRLRTAIIKNQPFVGPLKNFSYARNSISIYNDYLIHRNRKDHYHYVVSFNFALQVAIINHYEFAHIGQNKLYALLDWIIWHPKLRMICKDISIACHHCQLGKVSNIYNAPPTLKINTRFPFELVAVDLLQLPKSSKGNSYVFILIDHYSKWIATVPLKSKHTSIVTAALRTILPYLPLIPSRLLSDNAREFRGPEFEELLILHNIKHIYTTPYNPASNGITERVNRTLIQYLREEYNHSILTLFSTIDLRISSSQSEVCFV
ncbi:Pro-Pol polyprotein [Armadillidium vulgare]|nr:Pro-Pol polyprotein [Armadillidium vulgare]